MCGTCMCVFVRICSAYIEHRWRFTFCHFKLENSHYLIQTNCQSCLSLWTTNFVIMCMRWYLYIRNVEIRNKLYSQLQNYTYIFIYIRIIYIRWLVWDLSVYIMNYFRNQDKMIKSLSRDLAYSGYLPPASSHNHNKKELMLTLIIVVFYFVIFIDARRNT